MTTTRQYDNLNRLISISSAGTGSGAPQSSFANAYNGANQRTRVNLADGSFWAYEYDALGQVKSGKRYWSDWTPAAGQQFEYAFDDIGNRTSTKAGGNSAGTALRAATYSANTLNQITQRDVPGAVDIIGAATATATSVTVNNQPAYRRGEYYQLALSINNGSTPQWTSVTNLAVQSGTTNTVIGNSFLPQTAEILSYDADGNLTNDGRWMLTWDAENRPTKIESQASGPLASKRKITLDYDWRGRLIRRTEYNGASGSYLVTNDVKFLSDGLHCIAELNATNNALLRSYLSGRDVSGTMTGAGGVGGLLEINSVSNGVHFCAYDGNGNVTALVKGTDGTSSANYEFDPFGQAIRCTGVMAKENPYRSSTKRTDDATDLVHYEFRIYRPATGRWLSRDPIDERGGFHLYGFLRNWPTGNPDLLGLTFNWDPPYLYTRTTYIATPDGGRIYGQTDWYYFHPQVKVWGCLEPSGGCCGYKLKVYGSAKVWAWWVFDQDWARVHEMQHVNWHYFPAYASFKENAEAYEAVCFSRKEKALCIKSVIENQMKDLYMVQAYTQGSYFDCQTWGEKRP